MTAIEFAQIATDLPVDQQNALLANLKEVLTDEEYKATACFLSLYGMYHNPEKYEAMKNAMREVVCEELFGHAS